MLAYNLRMITVSIMGRRKLGRKRIDVTLPAELKTQAEELAAFEGRPLSHLMEAVLRPYVQRNWQAEMRHKLKRRER